MKSRFQRLYEVIMEQVGAPEDKTYEYEDMAIAVVPGSFKPPHKGHWEMVMKYIDIAADEAKKNGKKNGSKVVVLISNISTKAISERKMSATHLSDLQSIKKLADKAGLTGIGSKAQELYDAGSSAEEDAPGLTYNDLKAELDKLAASPELAGKGGEKVKARIEQYQEKLSKNLFTSIRKDANGNEITPEMSKEIFEVFANAYGVEDEVDIQVSQSASPITATFGLVNNACKNCKVLLGVSKKGGDEARFSVVKPSEDNPTNDVVPAPVDVTTMLSATELRNGINDLKKEWFPDKLSDSDFNKIKDILSRG